MVYVTREEMKRIRSIAAAKKAKREEKRATLPWAESVKKKATVSLWKWWAAKCDVWWGKAVRAIDRRLHGDVCRIRRAKNCTGRNEVGYHLITKSRGHAIRWHLSAGVAACAPCNKGEQMNRDLYAQYHDELFGREFMDELRRISHLEAKLDVSDLKELVQKFQAIYAANWSGQSSNTLL
jgi:hypothetical protein